MHKLDNVIKRTNNRMDLCDKFEIDYYEVRVR